MTRLIKSIVESIDQPGYYRDAELAGFCLRVSVAPQTGKITRVYLINTKPRGSRKNVSITIGKHGVISAEMARLEARRILGLLAQGINPNEQRKREQAQTLKEQRIHQLHNELEQITLERLLSDYLSAHQLKEKTAHDYKRFIQRCLKDWFTLPITQISRDMIQARHLQLSAKHPAQANSVMRILRALFKYAIAVYEDVEGKPFITGNPVDRLRHARLWNRVRRRQTVILPHQLRAWYGAVQGLNNETAKDLLLVELFTGLRHNEAAGLLWSNIDFKAEAIKIEDTKNHDDHMLPMSSYLQQILQRRYETRTSVEYVFPAHENSKYGHVTDIRGSVKQVIVQSGVLFTEHDLRRTFETTAESLDISYYSLKRLLNHRTGNDPTAGYIVLSVERLRKAAQKIANYLAMQMGIHPINEQVEQPSMKMSA